MQHFVDLVIARPWTLAFWVFVVGSAIGSFLNVVIYRLPRGMSLSRPGSRCPKCGHAIRWYHNLPIAGWILLRGKCYDCQAAISPRYPLVELAVAVIFVALAYVDVYLPAIKVADAIVASGEGPSAAPLARALVAFAAHAWLACALLAAALIRWDGERVPWRMIVPGVAVAAAAAPFVDVPRGSLLIVGAVVLSLLKIPRPRTSVYRRPGGPTGNRPAREGRD